MVACKKKLFYLNFHLIKFILVFGNLFIFFLTPKGQIMFFEFWSRSHFLSLHPNFLISLVLVPLFEIYLVMQFLLRKLFVDLEI